MNYILRIYKKGKMYRRVKTVNKHVFTQKLASASKNMTAKKIYLKVDYGNGFYNDGDYEDRKSLMNAFRAFIQE